jgi:hypothetical protein
MKPLDKDDALGIKSCQSASNLSSSLGGVGLALLFKALVACSYSALLLPGCWNTPVPATSQVITRVIGRTCDETDVAQMTQCFQYDNWTELVWTHLPLLQYRLHFEQGASVVIGQCLQHEVREVVLSVPFCHLFRRFQTL